MRQAPYQGTGLLQKYGPYLLLAFAFLLYCQLNMVFADGAKPRYVAGDGLDAGDCRNLFRPCRTLTYAISQAGKGDPILVTAGDYQIRSTADLYAAVSAAGRLRAGMDRLSDFTTLDTSGNQSTLSGVPAEYRELFQAAGFRVIADIKGISIEQQDNIRGLAKQLASVQSSHTQTACTNGQAGSFPCDNINLYSHLSLEDLDGISVVASDIWGFVDLNSKREYAFIGLSRGAALVDVTNPEEPTVIGTHLGSPSSWRDIKIYQIYDTSAERWRAYAYISTEANMDLTIIDLSDLPNSFEQLANDSDHSSAHNVYIANVDYSLGVATGNAAPLLTVAGAFLDGGRFRLYSLENPAKPSLISVSTTGYMHDAASLQVADARKDNQCINASDAQYCQVLADFNESSADIWDVTVASDPQLLSTFIYPDASYVHSGWWSENGQYLFIHDELDEMNFGLNTTVRVYDMRDLALPQFAGTWTGPTRAIDHNGFVRGNRYYMSNYTEGLTVLDISTPAYPTRVAHFDTVPTTSTSGFSGAWGVYPFLPSGTIVVSDINSGLFVLEDQSRLSANGSFAFSSPTFSGVEGTTLKIEVERQAGSTGAASIDLAIVDLTTDVEDTELNSTTLEWDAGDTTSKFVNIELNSDNTDEVVEQFALRLSNPTGGATLAVPNLAYGYISDAAAQTQLSLLTDAGSVGENQTTAFAIVKRLASSEGEASVSYRTLAQNAGDTFEASSGTLTWADGEVESKTVAINLLSSPDYDGDEIIELELHDPQGAALGTNAIMALTITEKIQTSDSPDNGQSVLPGNNNAPQGGGGKLGWISLVIFSGLLVWRQRRKSIAKL